MDYMVKLTDLIESMETLHKKRTRLIENYIKIVRVDRISPNFSKFFHFCTQWMVLVTEHKWPRKYTIMNELMVSYSE
jgi:hypothetical protein